MTDTPKRQSLFCHLLALAFLTAVSAAQEASLERCVWAYLDAQGRVAERAALKALQARDDLTVEALTGILDAGRTTPVPPPGVRADIPFTIPGIKKATTYTLGVPEGIEAGKRYPLWIAIHGTGGTERWAHRDIWRFLEPKGVICVAPTEAKDIHGGGWGYRHRERALHMGLLDELTKKLPIDLSRVYVSGLSRGGHASFDLAMRYSDRIAGSMPIIGAVQQRDRPLLLNMKHVRTHVMNGEQDQPALVKGARAAVERLKAYGYPTTAVFDPNRGHGSFADHYATAVAELMKNRRPVAPKEIAFAVRDLAYARHYWVKVTGLHKSTYKPGQRIKIQGVSKMDAAQREAAYLKYLDDHTPWIKASIKDNRIDITCKLVTRFDLYVPESAVDLSRPIQVWVQGKRRLRSKKLKQPSPVRRLQLMRSFGSADPAVRFVDRIPLKVR